MSHFTLTVCYTCCGSCWSPKAPCCNKHSHFFFSFTWIPHFTDRRGRQAGYLWADVPGCIYHTCVFLSFQELGQRRHAEPLLQQYPAIVTAPLLSSPGGGVGGGQVGGSQVSCESVHNTDVELKISLPVSASRCMDNKNVENNNSYFYAAAARLLQVRLEKSYRRGCEVCEVMASQRLSATH